MAVIDWLIMPAWLGQPKRVSLQHDTWQLPHEHAALSLWSWRCQYPVAKQSMA